MYRGRDSGVTRATGVLAGSTDALSLVDRDLAPSTTYWYVVEAVDAANNVGPRSAASSATTGADAAEKVTLTLDGDWYAEIPVDTVNGTDPYVWSTPLDTRSIADGAHTFLAEYDDGRGGNASTEITFHVSNAAAIDITSPTDGAETGRALTVSGVTRNTGGPSSAGGIADADGSVDSEQFALAALRNGGYGRLLDHYSAHPGFVALAPARDGTQALTAIFERAAPSDLREDLLPDGWTLGVEENAQFSRLRERLLQVVEAPPRQGPPLPAEADGIGPGSHLLITMPGGTFGCTASFVWKDTLGRLYLGAAGHCFLPEGKTSTHGGDADYDPRSTTVRACIAACTNGGQSGFLLTGTLATLGPVAYARQTLGGVDVGNDFGIVRIPDGLRNLVRTHVPVWNGPLDEGTMKLGDVAVHYGNAAALGEAWPTMARAGVGMGATSARWLANTPAFQGDSGAAMLSAAQTTANEAVEGVHAIGTLTHLVVSTGVVAGTTMARSKAMALEAGLTIAPVVQGESVITVPGAPTSLAAIPGDGRVSLSWTAPTDGGSAITSYTIKLGTASGAYARSVAATGTSAVVEGLPNGRAHFFVVTASNAIGESAASAEVTATPTDGRTPPGAPTGLAATAGNGEVALGWFAPAADGGSAITGYVLRWGTSAGGPYPDSLAVTGTSAAVTGLANGQAYRFVVAAVNDRGEGPASAEVAATPTDATVPATPTNVLAIAGDARVTISWDAPASSSPITGYTVKVGTTSGEHPASYPATTTTRTITGLVNGDAYYLVVSASNSEGEGAESAEVSATPQAAASADYDVEIRVLDGSTVVLGWTPADAYDGSSFSHAIDGLDPGAFTIEARLLEDGVVADVDDVAITAKNAAPTVDAGADADVDEGASITLTATGTDEDGDDLTYAWTQVAGESVALDGAATRSASFTAPLVADDATLEFEVEAKDGHGGTAKDRVAVTVLDTDEIAITSVNGESLTGTNKNLAGVATVAGTSHLVPSRASANVPPTAVISDALVDGMSVSASGATSFDLDGSIVAYAWNHGDGTTSSGATLAHEYAKEGSYILTLTVTDNGGASGQARYGPFSVVAPRPGLVVDAGDSSYVKIGEPVTLTATSFNAVGATGFSWDTDGDGTPDTSGQSIQVATAGRAPGATTFTVVGTDEDGRTATDSVKVLLYETTLVSHEFSNDVLVGLPDEDAGLSGTADGATFRHEVAVPANTEQLDAELNWTFFVDAVPPNPSGLAGGPNDFDLILKSPDGSQDTSAATFRAPETKTVMGPIAGTWTFEVRSYVVVKDRYTLAVDLLTAPPDPVPIANQISEVCQDAVTQLLEANATGAGTTGAWDTDLDGLFDDATGLTATTEFERDGVARLVRFRATTADGYRDTILVAIRPAISCTTEPSVVVIAVADTGVNPYHAEFAGERIPYPELRDATTADADSPGPLDRVVRHKVTNEVLPFTKHPSSYIPGFPATAEPIVLTLGGGYYKANDDAAVWNRGHEAIALTTWYWIPGTKIIGAFDASDNAAVNSQPDSTPIFDDDGHGTASVSVAVGNTWGSCPRCVVAFIEGLSGDAEAFGLSWVDFVSVSGGSLANVGIPDPLGVLGLEGETKAAAERGQTISYAAGNGVDNAFVVPEQTYASNTLGPDWTIDVGAVSKTSNAAMLGSGKPVDWSSFASGTIPAACRNSYSTSCGHSGTSAATPIATGHMASALLTVRAAIGDPDAGQKTAALAGGQRQAVAVGDEIPDSPYLEDGVLTRVELWDVAFHCASDLGAGVGFPGNAPASPVDYAYAGYGIADAAMYACAASALVSGTAVPEKPEADQFFEIDEAIRDALWGDWDGDGDGAPGGNVNTNVNPTIPGLGALAIADVDSIDEATSTIARAFSLAGLADEAPPVTETYYLHRAACASAADVLYMDRTPAAAEEGGNGCAAIAASMAATWTSVQTTTASFAAGSTVDARVRAFTVAPNPALTMRGTLLLDGVAVGTGTATIQVVSLALVSTPCHEWEIRFATTRDLPAGATLTFQATTDAGTGDVPVCYEGGTGASRVSITGVGEAPPTLSEASISSPAQDATLDPADGLVTITGTAEFPERAPVTTRYYLRRDACASLATDPMYLSPIDDADAGNGCALLLGAAAPVQEFVERYSLVAGELPIRLAPGGTIQGTIHFDADGPDVGQVEVRVQSSAGLVGKRTYDVTFVGVPSVTEPFALDVAIPIAPATAGVALDSLVLEIAILRQGPIHWTELDEPASHLDVPRLVDLGDVGRLVQVAIDDDAFATLLAVTGLHEWTATWDLADVPDGAHTVYARAGQDGTFGAFVSVGVFVERDTTPPPPTEPKRDGAIEIQFVKFGSSLGAGSWKSAAAYTNTTGNWSFDWDTDALKNGRYDFHARLLADGAEVARAAEPFTLSNKKKPVFTPAGPKTTSETTVVTFTVEATDENADPLTYSADGLPEGATFDAATREFAWTPTYEQAGAYEVTFRVTDGELEDTMTVSLTVINVNRAPALAAIGDKTISDGRTLSFQIVGEDADGDAMTFSAAGLPAGATFSDVERKFTWTPTQAQLGDYAGVTFTVADATLSDSETITIHVVDENLAPTIAAIADQTVSENAILTFAVVAEDPDGDAITVTASGLPDGAAFDAASRTFTWTPGYVQAGDYRDVRFSATDGEFTTERGVTIVVVNVNRPPALEPIGARSVAEDAALEFTAAAADPDGDALVFAATSLPAGATFDAATRAFAWRPGFDQAGEYQVRVQVTDGAATIEEVVPITVRDTNRAPTTTVTGPTLEKGAKDLAFLATGSDADGDDLAYAWDMGDGTTLGGASVTKAYATGGTFTVSVTVTDGKGGSGTATMSIVIDAAPPLTVPAVLGVSTPDGWFDETARVKLTAVDLVSGVKSTKYRHDGNAVYQPYATPFALPSGEAERIVHFYSDDKVGNVEEERTIKVKVDTVAPTVELALNHPAAAIVTPTNLSATAGDAGAGVAKVEFYADGILVCTDEEPLDGWGCRYAPDPLNTGRKTITAVAIDRLGHSESDSVAAMVVASPFETPLRSGALCEEDDPQRVGVPVGPVREVEACKPTFRTGETWVCANHPEGVRVGGGVFGPAGFVMATPDSDRLLGTAANAVESRIENRHYRQMAHGVFAALDSEDEPIERCATVLA